MTSQEKKNIYIMINIDITDNPFSWLHELSWNDLADFADDYGIMDDIYRILTEGYDERNIYSEEVMKMSIDEMNEYYQYNLSLALGTYLAEMGNSLQNGSLKLNINFIK